MDKKGKKNKEDINEVEQILDKRKKGRTNEYLVRWRGRSSDGDSWETLKSLGMSLADVEQFEERSLQMSSSDSESPRKSNSMSPTKTKLRTTVSESTTKTSSSSHVLVGGTPRRELYGSNADSTSLMSRRSLVNKSSPQSVSPAQRGGVSDSLGSCALIGGKCQWDRPCVCLGIVVVCLSLLAVSFVVW